MVDLNALIQKTKSMNSKTKEERHGKEFSHWSGDRLWRFTSAGHFGIDSSEWQEKVKGSSIWKKRKKKEKRKKENWMTSSLTSFRFCCLMNSIPKESTSLNLSLKGEKKWMKERKERRRKRKRKWKKMKCEKKQKKRGCQRSGPRLGGLSHCQTCQTPKETSTCFHGSPLRKVCTEIHPIDYEGPLPTSSSAWPWAQYLHVRSRCARAHNLASDSFKTSEPGPETSTRPWAQSLPPPAR